MQAGKPLLSAGERAQAEAARAAVAADLSGPLGPTFAHFRSPSLPLTSTAGLFDSPV